MWSLTDAERRALGFQPLPKNLDGALQVMEHSELVAETLGEHVFDFFLRNKRAEWEDYRRQVTPFELARTCRSSDADGRRSPRRPHPITRLGRVTPPRATDVPLAPRPASG